MNPHAPVAELDPGKIVSSGLCIGCGTCAALSLSAGIGLNRFGLYEAKQGPATTPHRDGVFAKVCPFSPSAPSEDEIAAQRFADVQVHSPWVGRWRAAYVGHVAQDDFRASGSSGGLVTWVAHELLNEGLVDGVAHVVPAAAGHPYFQYQISRTTEDLRRGAKSRYYPVELSGTLNEIRSIPGRYAIVGIPCFIKAVHLARAADEILAQRIVYTLGLVCGHMKSARFAESLAWQMDADVERMKRVEFRLKNRERPANWYRAQITLKNGDTKEEDWWHLADGDWGSGFFQSPACDYCDDVVAETADISFGDAWVEPYSSDGRGSNVVVVRSMRLHQLVDDARRSGRLSLEAVDDNLVQTTQAAGFRQRREGLAYRLTWFKTGIKPKKRVAASSRLPFRRKLVYRARHAISSSSHRVFHVARVLKWPRLYIVWARAALSAYHGVAYSRGTLGSWIDRCEAAVARSPFFRRGSGDENSR